MTKASPDLLESLHGAVATELLSRIRSGDAKPADIAAAIKFLKDNGVEAVGSNSPHIQGLKEAFPFPAEGDDGDSIYN